VVRDYRSAGLAAVEAGSPEADFWLLTDLVALTANCRQILRRWK
jgi:hypothetical protein